MTEMRHASGFRPTYLFRAKMGSKRPGDSSAVFVTFNL
jgi:hypothetical protein